MLLLLLIIKNKINIKKKKPEALVEWLFNSVLYASIRALTVTMEISTMSGNILQYAIIQ